MSDKLSKFKKAFQVISKIREYTSIYSIKTESITINEKHNLYLTMTFPDKENLNKAVFVDLFIDESEKGKETCKKHIYLKIIPPKKNIYLANHKQMIKIWDSSHMYQYIDLKTNIKFCYGTLDYFNIRSAGNHLVTFVRFSNSNFRKKF